MKQTETQVLLVVTDTYIVIGVAQRGIGDYTTEEE